VRFPVRMSAAAILWWLAAGAYIAAIIFMASRPVPGLLSRLPVPHSDKALHFIVYAVLALLLYGSLARAGLRNPAVWAVVLAVATGMADEYVQSFTRYRNSSLSDLLADVAGAAAGILIAAGTSFIRGGGEVER